MMMHITHFPLHKDGYCTINYQLEIRILVSIGDIKMNSIEDEKTYLKIFLSKFKEKGVAIKISRHRREDYQYDREILMHINLSITQIWTSHRVALEIDKLRTTQTKLLAIESSTNF